MSDATPSDYEVEDGLNDGAIDQCPHCGQSLYPHDHSGPVYDPNGREYHGIMDTDPKDGPFFCRECWRELDANRKQQENQTLGDYE